MVKDSENRILFSLLLKKDDGVLRALLQERGLGEIEVAAAVDRFIFELKHATADVGGIFELKGFGVLKHESSGKILFLSSAEVESHRAAAEQERAEQERIEQERQREYERQREHERAEQERQMEHEGIEREKIEREQNIERVSEVEKLKQVKEANESPTLQVVELDDESSTPRSPEITKEAAELARIKEVAQVPQNDAELETTRYSAQRIKELYSRPQTFREKDPEIGDLTYSKRQKSLDAYTYVRRGSAKKSVDKVLLFGIIAAIIAVGVIAYGCYVSHLEEITDLMYEWGLKSVESTSEVIESTSEIIE